MIHALSLDKYRSWNCNDKGRIMFTLKWFVHIDGQTSVQKYNVMYYLSFLFQFWIFVLIFFNLLIFIFWNFIITINSNFCMNKEVYTSISPTVKNTKINNNEYAFSSIRLHSNKLNINKTLIKFKFSRMTDGSEDPILNGTFLMHSVCSVCIVILI